MVKSGGASVSAYDHIIIGGGTNGLTAAAYLAKAGKRVLVIEARAIVGGYCTTEEMIPSAPGFKFNPTSLDHVMLMVEPSVVTELGLEQYGLRYLAIDPFYSYLRSDGFAIRFWRDHRKTVDEIAQFSPRDAKAYDQMTRALGALWHVGFPYLMGHPTRPKLSALAQTASRAWSERSVLMQAARMVMMSPLDIILQNFESDEMRTALGCFSASNCSPLDFPGTGIIMAAMALQHRYGVYRAVGGGGQFPAALVKLIQAHGGEVMTGAPVQQVIVENGNARGVHLADGREFMAGSVIAAISPKLLFNGLVSEENVSDKIRDEIAAISVCGSNINSMTGGVAYATRPLLQNDPAHTAQLLGSSILVADDLQSICDWISEAEAGRIGKRPPGWFITPSVQDRTLVPDGNAGEAMYVYLPVASNKLAGGTSLGASWAEQKDGVFGAALDMLHAKAPGLAEAEIGRFAVSPDDLATYSYQCSHPFHLDMSLSQMGPWRPTPSLSDYRTPIKGLYHSGAGAHPMGTVNGWSGRTVARMLLAGG
jgi:beta-carotene ketolase (CrtO type)